MHNNLEKQISSQKSAEIDGGEKSSRQLLAYNPASSWTPLQSWVKGDSPSPESALNALILPCVHRLHIAFCDATVSTTTPWPFHRTTNPIFNSVFRMSAKSQNCVGRPALAGATVDLGYIKSRLGAPFDSSRLGP